MLCGFGDQQEHRRAFSLGVVSSHVRRYRAAVSSSEADQRPQTGSGQRHTGIPFYRNFAVRGHDRAGSPYRVMNHVRDEQGRDDQEEEPTAEPFRADAGHPAFWDMRPSR